ncbi:hypothetical protein BC830DRAFT_842422 [Chytriomyces sp. MP71]|nr:hypothetical protein BC830DRAFT_842422 [Chytriomyces sp. MP71]
MLLFLHSFHGFHKLNSSTVYSITRVRSLMALSIIVATTAAIGSILSWSNNSLFGAFMSLYLIYQTLLFAVLGCTSFLVAKKVGFITLSPFFLSSILCIGDPMRGHQAVSNLVRSLGYLQPDLLRCFRTMVWNRG